MFWKFQEMMGTRIFKFEGELSEIIDSKDNYNNNNNKYISDDTWNKSIQDMQRFTFTCSSVLHILGSSGLNHNLQQIFLGNFIKSFSRF